MENLKIARNKKKFTQAQMAEKLNLSTTAYQFYEMGRNEPSIATLKAISKILDVTIDYLVNNENANSSNIVDLKDDLDKVIAILENMKDKL